MGMIRWLGFAAGIVLLLATASSAIKTLLIPRAARTVLGSSLAWLVRGAFRNVTARVEDLRQRERILAATGPVWLISLLVCWLVCLLLGDALLLWPLNHRPFPVPPSLGTWAVALVPALPPRPVGRGPRGVVPGLGARYGALERGLPQSLAGHNAVSLRRERPATPREAVPGAPPWGPELLA